MEIGFSQSIDGAEQTLGSVFVRSFVRSNERIDDLQRDGLMILQRPDSFRFGTDAVLLSDFAQVKPHQRVVDLGAGTGILCLLMAANESGATFDAVEIQEDMADMARRSVEMNRLESRIRVHNIDMRKAWTQLGHQAFDHVVCNPPYSPAGTSIKSQDEGISTARHAMDLTLAEIAQSGSRLLRNGGRMALIYPAPRMLQLMQALVEENLQPKRIRIIQDRPDAVPKLIMLEAVKGAKPMLHWMPPLILRQRDGSWTRERNRIYHIEDDNAVINPDELIDKDKTN